MTGYSETAHPVSELHSERDWMSRLPALLRILGTGVLVIAMYSFLVKGWQQGNDVFRYLIMLAHTGVLAAVGLASGHWLKEGKGARLFLILAVASVPVNFAILSAFIYSQTGALQVSHYPDYVAWSVDSLSTALFTTAGALLVLLPVTWLGFTVLARSMSRQLTGLFVLSNAALLLPLRDPQLIGLLVLALAAANIVFSGRMSAQQIAARTREGITALALQFLPLAILMGRSLWLYAFDLFLINVMTVTVFFVMRQVSLYLLPGSRMRATVDGLSVIPAIASMPLLAAALRETGMVPEALLLPAGAMAAAAMIYEISRRSVRGGFYRDIATLVLLLSVIANLFLHSGVLAALTCVAIGAGTLVIGYRKQHRNVFTSGIVMILFGVLQQIFELVQQFDLSNWVTLAVLGVLVIVLGSVIDSQRGNIRVNFGRWRTNYKQWDR